VNFSGRFSQSMIGRHPQYSANMSSGEDSGVPTTEPLQAYDDSTFWYSRNTNPTSGQESQQMTLSTNIFPFLKSTPTEIK